MSMQNVNHFRLIVNDSILTVTISLSVMKRAISDTKVIVLHRRRLFHKSF